MGFLICFYFLMRPNDGVLEGELTVSQLDVHYGHFCDFVCTRSVNFSIFLFFSFFFPPPFDSVQKNVCIGLSLKNETFLVTADNIHILK